MPQPKTKVPAKTQEKDKAAKAPAKPVQPAKRPRAGHDVRRPKPKAAVAPKPATESKSVSSKPASITPKPPALPMQEAPNTVELIASRPATGWRAAIAWCTPERLYAWAALAVLFGTTWYWALLGARIHMGNSDQLVNTYLFDSSDTFRGAAWPDQHTFLFKWPLFALMHAFGATSQAFAVATVGIALLTVMTLALVLYRIERRPLLFGSLCLALASVLLLIPAQPYPGGILPVNMAMTTTRNIEYLLFIGAVAFVAHAPRVLHWKTIVALALIIALVASDKLFLTIGIGASVVMLMGYALLRKWAIVQFSARWFLVSVAGGAAAVGVLWAVNASGVTHIMSGGLAGPYGFVHSTKDIVLGGIYAVLGLLTNLGANPATDTRLLATIPSQAYHHVFTPSGLTLLINMLLAVAMLLVTVRFLWSSIARRGVTALVPHDRYFNLSLALIWSTAAAVAVFMASKHYYPVDARYVAIVLFAGFIALATYVRTHHWRARTVWLAAVVLGCSVFAGVTVAGQQYDAEVAAMHEVNDRNIQIANAIDEHGVEAIVGDYWRVLPVKLQMHNDIQAVPLSSCTQPGGILNSKAWQPDLRRHSFVYLLTLDKSLTGYPPCSLQEVVAAYGRPNASTLISGTLSQPREILVFYDRGARNSAPRVNAPAAKLPETVVPVPLLEVPYTACTTSTTTMNIVAHQDDDLLFMNPAIQHDIQAGHCVRTIYVTSGDAGAGSFYWVSREQGSEAAYSAMLGHGDIWIKRLVVLPGGQYVTIANPRGKPNLSLIFMHLPDGNLHGQGFDASHHESIARLEGNFVSTLHAVDHQSTYTYTDLTTALEEFMRLYQPAEIRTQSGFVSRTHPDHSDHMAVGRATRIAYDRYIAEQFGGKAAVPLEYYIGYPVHGMPANVTGDDLEAKERAFFAYAHYDGNVCSTIEICTAQGTNYQFYLQRMYKNDY